MKDLLEKVRKMRREAEDQDVARLTTFIDKQLENGANISIPVLEAVLAHYKKQEQDILSGDLLEWMRENDMESFENDELKVSINTYVNAKMKDPEAGFKWLISNQYGDLIKDTLDFPKGELTERIQKYLHRSGVSYTKKSGIHPQSLKKIISDRLKAGEELPDEDDGINVNYFDICKVKEK